MTRWRVLALLAGAIVLLVAVGGFWLTRYRPLAAGCCGSRLTATYHEGEPLEWSVLTVSAPDRCPGG